MYLEGKLEKNHSYCTKWVVSGVPEVLAGKIKIQVKGLEKTRKSFPYNAAEYLGRSFFLRFAVSSKIDGNSADTGSIILRFADTPLT